jgi:mRNA interferase RelE/StbE
MKHSLYRLKLPDEIAELIRSLHPQLRRKVRSALEHVLADPGAGKALRDELAGLRSFRIGRYRLIYRVEERRTVVVVALGPRVRIYEETYRLVKRGVRRHRKRG